jgi:hypothetical protein
MGAALALKGSFPLRLQPAVDLVDRGLQKPHDVVRLSAYGGELFHRLDHDRYHFGGQI